MSGVGDAAPRGEDLRRRLREVRRLRAGLRLGPGPGVPARLGRGTGGDRRGEAGRQPGVLHPLRAARAAPPDHAFGGRAALRSRRAPAALGQGRHADHAHRRLRRIPGEGSLDLGAPGAAACARGRGRRWICAPSSNGCASTCSCAACGATRCATRCATCANACGASCRAPSRARASSTSSRTPAAPPTSSSWRSTGRCCTPVPIRRW